MVDGTCNDVPNNDSSEPTDDQQAERVFSEVQTDLTSPDIFQMHEMQQELITAYHKIHVLEVKLNSLQPFTEENFQDDDRHVHFYTGLSCFKLLKQSLNMLAHGYSKEPIQHSMHI